MASGKASETGVNTCQVLPPNDFADCRSFLEREITKGTIQPTNELKTCLQLLDDLMQVIQEKRNQSSMEEIKRKIDRCFRYASAWF